MDSNCISYTTGSLISSTPPLPTMTLCGPLIAMLCLSLSAASRPEAMLSQTGSTRSAVSMECLLSRLYWHACECVQMVFEYRPNSLEIVESLWKFSIPSLNLSHSFLLVGHTLDPSVFFDRTFFSYQTLLIGKSICVVLHAWHACPCVLHACPCVLHACPCVLHAWHVWHACIHHVSYMLCVKFLNFTYYVPNYAGIIWIGLTYKWGFLTHAQIGSLSRQKIH